MTLAPAMHKLAQRGTIERLPQGGADRAVAGGSLSLLPQQTRFAFRRDRDYIDRVTTLPRALSMNNDAAEIIQGLHDCEIDGGVEWLYDGAWRAWIGINDPIEGRARDFAEAVEWLRAKAIELYPDCEFARRFRRELR